MDDNYENVKCLSLFSGLPINAFIELVREGTFKFTRPFTMGETEGELIISYSRGVLFFIFPEPVTGFCKDPRVTLGNVTLDLRDYSENCLFSNNKENNEAFIARWIAYKKFDFLADTKNNIEESSEVDMFDVGNTVVILAKGLKITITNPYCIIESRMAPYYSLFAVGGQGLDLTQYKSRKLNDMVIYEGNFSDYKDSLKYLIKSYRPRLLFEMITK